MMRNPNCTGLTSDAELLLRRASRCWFATHAITSRGPSRRSHSGTAPPASLYRGLDRQGHSGGAITFAAIRARH
jgi:hypothetical protein